MKIEKKVAGGADTLGDLKEFIHRAQAEGFDDDSRINGGHTVGLFVVVSDGDEAIEADSDYVARCPECRREDTPSDRNGVLLVHYRGDTRHKDAQCYGVGKKGYSVRTK